jgi:hypothetical protein
VLDGKAFSQVVDNSLKYLSGSIKSFDLYTKLDNGICYGRYILGSGSDIVYLNSPILQVGKFKGDFPFEINYSGEYESEIISDEISIPEANILQSDSLLEEIWTGIYIQHMENQTQTNDVITEIIQNSLGERVLSLYTAFLCIEEAMMPCDDCEEPNNTAVPDVKISSQDILKAFPNPFSGPVTISVNLNEINAEKVVRAGIYSVTGEVVFMADTDASQSQREFELLWDGCDKEGNPVPSGVYIFILQTDKSVYQVKLIKQ